MKALVLIALASLCIAFEGCRSPMSPREAFLSHTSDRTNYHKLYEVSIEAIRAEEERVLRLTQILARSARDVSTNCTACPPLQEGFARVEHFADQLHKEQIELLDQLEKNYDAKSDAILFYHYWAAEGEEDVGYQEWGYLITRGGVVKKKVLIGGGNHD